MDDISIIRLASGTAIPIKYATITAPLTGIQESVVNIPGPRQVEFTMALDRPGSESFFTLLPTLPDEPRLLVVQAPIAAHELPDLLRRMADYLEQHLPGA